MATRFLVVPLVLLAKDTMAQISESTQERLTTLSMETLKSGEASLAEIADAAEVLASMSKPTSSVKPTACKRVASLLYRQEWSYPSTLYQKSQIKQYLDCDTLGGVPAEINALMEGKTPNMEELSDKELYYAHMLYNNAGVYGAKSPPSSNFKDLIADRAVNDWLKNFKPEKWTMKRNKIETVMV